MESTRGEATTGAKQKVVRRKPPKALKAKKRAWYSYTQAAERARIEFDELQAKALGLTAENEGLRQLEEVLTVMVLESSDTLQHAGALAFHAEGAKGAAVLDTLCMDMEVMQALDGLQAPLQLPAGLSSSSKHAAALAGLTNSPQQLFTTRCLQAAGAAGRPGAVAPEQLLQLVRQQVLELARFLDAGSSDDQALQPLVDRYVQLHVLALTAGGQAAHRLGSTNLATLEEQEATHQHWQAVAAQLQQLLWPEQVQQLRQAYKVYEFKRGIQQAELRRLAMQLAEHIAPAAPAAPAPIAAAAAVEDASSPASPCLVIQHKNAYCPDSFVSAASPATSAAVNNCLLSCPGGASTGTSAQSRSAASGSSSPSIISMLENSSGFMEFMAKPEHELLQELNQHLFLHVASAAAADPTSPHTCTRSADTAGCFTSQCCEPAAAAADAHAAPAPAVVAPSESCTPGFSFARLWDASCSNKEVWETCDKVCEVAGRLHKQLKLCKQLDTRLELLWMNMLEARQLARAAQLSYPFACRPVHLCQYI